MQLSQAREHGQVTADPSVSILIRPSGRMQPVPQLSYRRHHVEHFVSILIRPSGRMQPIAGIVPWRAGG